ncbi:MAG TPA: hypothetical protein DHV15_11715 [Treponema sp.]|uniref:Uncharacterized protein n=1 Tax=Treponema denticola (strain ATCC 35405 / DSM 14222 / CIP 103919 / JCM 8153 / KCTC 15104) TaxID=243275 RepID=Q73MX1_TREDE|nr:hypothetical protein TDE_1385 [Treponema denticola ATCC 35405]HCY96153.1 hypothetical protein [Treponema sp.]
MSDWIIYTEMEMITPDDYLLMMYIFYSKKNRPLAK